MSEKIDDRRVRKTKKALRQGLVVLMAQKPLKDISVRELTDFVDLHRGTFYVHYKDVYDLYEQIQNEIIIEISRILDEYPARKLNGVPFPMIFSLITYLHSNSEICKMLFSANGDKSFMEQLSGLIHKKSLDDLVDIYRDSDRLKQDLFVDYTIAGCIGVLKKWIEQGMPNTPEQLSSQLEKLIIQGISFLNE